MNMTVFLSVVRQYALAARKLRRSFREAVEAAQETFNRWVELQRVTDKEKQELREWGNGVVEREYDPFDPE